MSFNSKKIVIIGANYPEYELYCSNMSGMQAGLKTLKIPFRFVTCRPDLNVDDVVSFNPDLIVYALKDLVLRSDWRKEIREKCKDAKIVLWYGDYRDEKTQCTANVSEVDCMFVSNDAQEQMYKRFWKVPRVEFLPLGCEPLEDPLYNPKFNFPFVFIGGQITGIPYYDRAKLVNEFQKFTPLKVINSFENSLRAKIFKAMPEIYGSSKVVLDISHFVDVKGYTSNRFWIIPACYGFALTKRFPGCTDFYPEDIRVYFSTFEEAIEKLEYYLNHEDERKKMIELAHIHSYNHSYSKRWLQMFILLSQD